MTNTEHYDNHHYREHVQNAPEDVQQFFAKEAEAIEDIVGGDVLEIGAGDGRSIPQISSLAQKATCIDNSKIIWQAPRYRNVSLQRMNALRLQYADEWFDTALMLGGTMMNLFPQEKDAITEAYRVLRRRGRGFISTVRADAKEFHEGFYRANNLPIRSSDRDLITLETGLISKRHSYQELQELMGRANITSYDISELTEHTYQVQFTKA